MLTPLFRPKSEAPYIYLFLVSTIDSIKNRYSSISGLMPSPTKLIGGTTV